MEERKLRLKEMENYKNGILYSIFFGNIFLKKQKIFYFGISKYIIYALLFALFLGVIFPFSVKILEVLRLSLITIFGISIFFAFLYLLNRVLSNIFKGIPTFKLVYFKRINTIFYFILFTCNIFYIRDVLEQFKSFEILNFKFNLFDISFYSAVFELIIIILFIFLRFSIKTFIKAKNEMNEYYYKNYSNMTQHKKNEIFSVLIDATKEVRILFIALICLILLKFTLFYELEIYQYKINSLPVSQIKLVLSDFIKS